MPSYWRHAPWIPWLLSACIETKNDDGDDGDENKKAKDTKKCFIKSELKLEYYNLISFQKLNFGNNSQKTRKSRYQIFLDLSSFTGFIYFVPNILPRIVV